MKLFITGGCGSIGKVLIKYFYELYPNCDITVFSRDEYKHAVIKQMFPRVNSILGDICVFSSVYSAMQGHTHVIHAAAMKRIEICERLPLQATQNNILGTANVVESAKKLSIENLVSLSTDKAVDPINTYGMTKYIAEQIVLNAGYNCTRYGNVFGSRGSVVEIFHKQSQQGLPITVTNDEMTRFIMQYNDAVELVHHALVSPLKKCIFVPEMKAARIMDLAHVFSETVNLIGQQPNEKVHECLITQKEIPLSVTNIPGKIIILPSIKEVENWGQPYMKLVRPYTSNRVELLTVDELSGMVEEWKKGL